MAVKRGSASSTFPKLASRPSPFHAAVALFEPADTSSSRVRRRASADSLSSLSSLDDATSTASALVGPSPAKRAKLEPAEDEDGLLVALSAPRRSPRKTSQTVKVQVKAEMDVKLEDELPDIEDSVSDTFIDASAGPSRTRKRKVIKQEIVKVAGDTLLTAQKTPSPRKPKGVQKALAIPHPAPDSWQEAYDAIRRMRADIVAPVDTMGCERAQDGEGDGEPKNQRFATLVSLMLSSQTKDAVTDAAVRALRAAVGGALSAPALLAADDTSIASAINKVGFWRRKTEYLRKTAQRLQDEYDGDVPRTAEELCALPGVGPKMAFLALHVAWGVNAGIGVDVHVHRITNRLGWHKPPTRTPEQTRVNLESWLPSAYHKEINHLLVGFGQVICLPVGPRCDRCELGTRKLCPSARVVSAARGKRTKAGASVAKEEVQEEAKPAIIVGLDASQEAE